MPIGLFKWVIQMSIKKVLAFTGNRADYDLLSGVFIKLDEADGIDLKLLVSGAHLSLTYGYTVRHIEQDGLSILGRIESLIDSNTPSSRLKTLAILLHDCITLVNSYKPDLIIYAGDREEVMVGALVGSYLKIPTIHFFGGDHATDGNVDNPIRHATSKLSTLHFVTHRSHKQRLMTMGENEKRIHLIGNPALDKYRSTPTITRKEILKEFSLESWNEYAIVIFHPILGCEQDAGLHFKEILEALVHLKQNAFISYPNTDSGNKHIIEVIEQNKSNSCFYFYKNLDRNIFINLMKNAKYLIGNSSAGIFEAPFIGLPVVNVGLRQKGRLAAANVVFVDTDFNSIVNGVEKVISDDFVQKSKLIDSPYGDGDSIKKAVQLIKEIDVSKIIYKVEDPLL